MKYSEDRILTTHVGSLPRPDTLAEWPYISSIICKSPLIKILLCVNYVN